MDMFSENLLGMLLVIALPLAGIFIVRRWLKRQSDTSVFHGADDLEDVGFTLLQSLGNLAGTRQVASDKRVFLPTIGVRLGIPAITALAWVLYQNAPTDQLWRELGVTNPLVETVALGLIGLIILQAWLWIALFHRVTVDGDRISVVTESFRTKHAQLSDLVSVRVVDKRPLYQMQFADGRTLVFSKFLSQRAELLALLTAEIENGAPPARRAAPADNAVALAPRGGAFARRLR